MELLSLPEEVLLHIFKQHALEVKDVFNLMITCKSFCSIIRNSSEFWKLKFCARWPQLGNSKSLQPSGLSWRDLVLLRIKTGLRVHKLLKELSPRCYADIEPPVNMMDNILTPDQILINLGREIFVDFVEDELCDIIFHSHQDKYLTTRYYARKVLQYLRTVRLETQWEDLLRCPQNEQSLIEGAILISQWGQMDEEILPDLQNTLIRIEEIVNEIKQKLEIQFLSSSLCSNPIEPRQAKKILACINQVFFDELGFQGNIDNYHSFENSYIDQVLNTKKGIPITMCILYQEVAKRLGVECEPVSFPQHFLLRWKEFPEEHGNNQFTYVDVFNRGSFHLRHSCPALIGRSRAEIRPEAYSSVVPAQVFQRMANNLIQCSRLLRSNGGGDNSRLLAQLHFTRLSCAISRRQPQPVVAYAELCVYLGVHLEEAIHLLQSAGAGDSDDMAPGHWARVRQITSMKCVNKLSFQKDQLMKRQTVKRSPSVKYAVGLIMRHKRYGYSCVISSWDAKCLATEEWIERMNVRSLERGTGQPFYHVLVDDGSYRYAAEENLELHPEGKVIDHPDIGIHFSRYEGRRYIPNTEKAAHFPEDEEVARRLLN